MRKRSELRLLLVAVLVMMIGVLASLGILARASSSLAEAHEVIVENAAPSVVTLDVAQARLRKVNTLVLERRMDVPDDAALRDAAIAAAVRDLDRAIGDYLALPSDPGEVPFQQAVTESHEYVNRVVNRALELEPGALDDSGLRRELDASMAQLSLDLVRASEFNASIARVAADEVSRMSTRYLPMGALILVITGAAAVLTLAQTYRAVERAHALAAQSLTALELRAEELESFAGRVAHDLLSPLMTVSLALDMANRRLTEPDDAPTLKAVTRASHTLQRVRGFVSDLLEFARAGAKPTPGGRARVDDVVHAIAEELGPVAQDAGVELLIEAPMTGHAVACSPGVLTSILSNLVQNAIKYIGDGEVRRVSIRAVDQGDEVRIEVQDTGAGISPSVRARLFEPYARGSDAKAPGLGLGLATVRRLVESHGGHVGAETEPGRGSTFWFSMTAVA